MACNLWSMLVRDDDDLPMREPEEGIDFVNVWVDGHNSQPVRHDGAGPSGRSLRPDEGFDAIRRLYVPHDGFPHHVSLEFRTNNMRNYHRRVQLAEPITNEASAGATTDGAPIAPEYTAHQAEADAIRTAFGHAALMGGNVVALSHRHVTESARMHRDMMAGHSTLLAEVVKANAAAHAAASAASEQRAAAAHQHALAADANAARAYEHAQQSLQHTLAANATAAANAIEAAGERGGLLDMLAPLAPMAMTAGAALWDRLGGLDGVLDKAKGLIGGAAAAGDAKSAVILAGVDRFSEALETMAGINAARNDDAEADDWGDDADGDEGAQGG